MGPFNLGNVYLNNGKKLCNFGSDIPPGTASVQNRNTPDRKVQAPIDNLLPAFWNRRIHYVLGVDCQGKKSLCVPQVCYFLKPLKPWTEITSKRI